MVALAEEEETLLVSSPSTDEADEPITVLTELTPEAEM